MGILIDEGKCIGCGQCQTACPYDAIQVFVLARVDNNKCVDCQACVDYCPTDAIAMEVPPPVKVGPAPQDTTFDAVVIGSGVGGVCAAARLAHDGYKTLLVERRPSVGGSWSSLRHNGLDMPTGAYAIEIRGALEETFRDVGAEFDVIEPSPPNVYCYQGQIIDPGEGRGRLRRALMALCPDPEEVDEVLGALRRGLSGEELPDPELTLAQWLDTLTAHQGIKWIFYSLARATQGAEEVKAVDFMHWLSNVRPTSYALSRRPTITMPRELTKVVTRNGGQVWTRTRVKEILVEGGMATGVVVERQGREVAVQARIVVSDIGPKETAWLAGHENLPPDYVARFQGVGLSHRPHIDMYIESEEPLFPVPSIVFPIGTPRLCTAVSPTHVVEWGPKGRHLTIVEGVAQSPDLQREAEEVMKEADQILPGWREKGKLLMVVTIQGEAYREPATETPIPNLFNVGQRVQAESAPGLPQGAETAKVAVALIEERFPLAREGAGVATP